MPFVDRNVVKVWATGKKKTTTTKEKKRILCHFWRLEKSDVFFYSACFLLNKWNNSVICYKRYCMSMYSSTAVCRQFKRRSFEGFRFLSPSLLVPFTNVDYDIGWFLFLGVLWNAWMTKWPCFILLSSFLLYFFILFLLQTGTLVGYFYVHVVRERGVFFIKRYIHNSIYTYKCHKQAKNCIHVVTKNPSRLCGKVCFFSLRCHVPPLPTKSQRRTRRQRFVPSPLRSLWERRRPRAQPASRARLGFSSST